MAYLGLVRHGESEWNARDLWTGWKNIPLSEKGRVEARIAGQLLKGIDWNVVFQSALIRAKQTTEEIVKELGINPSIISNQALDERDYGVYTGRNKQEVKKDVGDVQYIRIRRSWDEPIPSGESLKDVYSRVVPYYEDQILPRIKNGENVLISAHGNSLRALVKYLENISDEEIPMLEIATGEVYLYQIDESGKIVSKEIRKPSQ